MNRKATLLALLVALAAQPALAAGADPIRSDSTPPVVAGLHLTPGRQLTFSVSEYALVHVAIRRRASDGRMHRVAVVERVFMPGSGRIPLGRPTTRAGAYSATVTANDVAHNRTPAQTLRFRTG